MDDTARSSWKWLMSTVLATNTHQYIVKVAERNPMMVGVTAEAVAGKGAFDHFERGIQHLFCLFNH